MVIIDNIDSSDFKDLIREEIQRMINFTNDENSGQSASTNIANKHQKKKNKKKDEKCYHCLKFEHFARDCKMKLKDKDNDEDKRDGNFKGEKIKSFDDLVYNFMTIVNSDIPRDPNSWVLDSDATNFMHPDRN